MTRREVLVSLTGIVGATRPGSGCRCTGFTEILEAVELAALRMAGAPQRARQAHPGEDGKKATPPSSQGVARAGARGPTMREAAEQADGGLAMVAGDGHDVIEDPAFVRATAAKVAPALGRRVLMNACPGHGHRPECGFGNRYF